MAQAFLTHQYELKGDQGMYTHTPSKTMRALEIRTKSGKPITVLQSEDTPIAIESVLKENGWQIVSWNGLNIQLKAAPVAAAIPSAASPGQKAQPSPKAGAIGCLVFVAIAVLLGSCAAIVGGGSENSTPKAAPYSTSYDALSACERIVDARLGDSLQYEVSGEEALQVVDSETNRNWLVKGDIEITTEKDITMKTTYICYAYYDVEKQELDTNTSGLSIKGIDR